MLRGLDVATGANPVFAVSGMPGVVGGGTREFWRELVPHLSGDRNFAIWPFEGELNALLASRGVVLCETYPALAYAAALADDLPTGQTANSKTKPEWRNEACDRLTHAGWVRANGIDLGDLARVRANEDDFDAHFTAAAVLRCILEGRELAHANWIDAEAEGSMLLAGIIEPDRVRRASIGTTARRPRRFARTATSATTKRRRSTSKAVHDTEYRCPIPGCERVFVGSRRGWDAHVGSARLHRGWRPDVADPKERRRMFREEFGHWFG